MKKKKKVPNPVTRVIPTQNPGKTKVPGRRFEILSILSHDAPRDVRFWSADALSKIFGISSITAFHALTRLKKYGLVESSKTGAVVEFSKQLLSGEVSRRVIPLQTLSWSVTGKGRDRVKYAGGHEIWCPQCRPTKESL